MNEGSELKVGKKLWIPCEVKPGPFSNERFVRIQFPSGIWVGFVDTQALKEPIERGNTQVLARITAIAGSEVTALVQGHAFDTRYVTIPRTTVEPVVSLQT